MELAGVIHIGSSQFRLVIAEISNNGQFRTIDVSEKPVNLGKDVFTRGIIRQRTMNLAIQILHHFREQLAGWKIHLDSVQIIATSALREAKNRDAFLDRVEVRTGFKISVIDGIEETRLSYLSVQYALTDYQGTLNKSNSLIIEVGGGSTEIILLNKGQVVAVHSLNIGAVRVEQQLLDSAGHLGENLENFLSQNIRTMLERLDREVKLSSIKHFVAIGSYSKLADTVTPTEDHDHYKAYSKEAFLKAAETITKAATTGQWDLLPDYLEYEEGLAAAVVILRQFLEETSADKILIPNANIDEGIFVQMGSWAEDSIKQRFNKQIIASASNLAKKYLFDQAHARHVTKLALKLFDELQDEHGLNKHARMLLQVAGILHDIGTFIKSSGHHKHGQYIVQNSEIFGLNEIDLKVVANLVRYHRRSAPQANHSNYASLAREHRLLVLKLSSILRVADALDRGHVQRIKTFKVEKSIDRLILNCEYNGDISVERFSLSTKAIMFEDVFGMKVMVR